MVADCGSGCEGLPQMIVQRRDLHKLPPPKKSIYLGSIILHEVTISPSEFRHCSNGRLDHLHLEHSKDRTMDQLVAAQASWCCLLRWEKLLGLLRAAAGGEGHRERHS